MSKPISLAAERVRRDADLGTRYLPSSGSEGEWFHATWCRRCTNDRWDERGWYECTLEIDLVALGAEQGDPATWPTQWRDDGNGPRCTAFAPRTPAQRAADALAAPIPNPDAGLNDEQRAYKAALRGDYSRPFGACR